MCAIWRLMCGCNRLFVNGRYRGNALHSRTERCPLCHKVAGLLFETYLYDRDIGMSDKLFHKGIPMLNQEGKKIERIFKREAFSKDGESAFAAK
jgi:hypothetical protein